MSKLRRDYEMKRNAAEAERQRSLKQPQTDRALEALTHIIGQYKRLHHIGMFLGQVRGTRFAELVSLGTRACIIKGIIKSFPSLADEQ